MVASAMRPPLAPRPDVRLAREVRRALWHWEKLFMAAGVTMLFLGLTLLIGRVLVTGRVIEERSGTLLSVNYLKSGRETAYLGEQPTACSGYEERELKGKYRLPPGISTDSTDLHLRRLWGKPEEDLRTPPPKNLLAMAVGITLKASVDQIVRKFPLQNFTIMLFHYDGAFEEWNKFDWNAEVVHVVAKGQTKWWFAKRFLHPDVVAAYDYIFVWDEDLGVEHFDANRYVQIVREYGLEVSQPGLDGGSDMVHHPHTRRRHSGSEPIHRTSQRLKGRWKCNASSIEPPCAGWVEIMAPVFSRDSWSCFWHLLQNDLVHGWGFDLKVGYCARGARHKTVGVVDEQYVTHRQGLTLFNKPKVEFAMDESCVRDPPEDQPWCRCGLERRIFLQRWRKAIREDTCWKDPYPNYKGPDSTKGGWKREKREKMWAEEEEKEKRSRE